MVIEYVATTMFTENEPQRPAVYVREKGCVGDALIAICATEQIARSIAKIFNEISKRDNMAREEGEMDQALRGGA